MKKFLLITTLLLVAILALAGCRNEDDADPYDDDDDVQVEETQPAPDTDPDEDDPDEEEPDEELFYVPDEDVNPLAAEIMSGVNAVLERFPSHFDDGGVHVEGTTLLYGISSPTPWLGIIGGGVFSTSAICGEIAGFIGTGSSILSTTTEYTFGQDGIANFELDLANNRIIFNMQQDVYWHDGTPLTLADLAFAYYILADPDYRGIRFSAGEQRVRGIMDYHEGYAEYISGLVLSNNDRTLTMYFDEMSPEMLNFGIWTAPIPRHIFEGIPVGEMAESPYVRETPIGWGPFILESVVPGESVYLRRNENFVWGTPYIESVVIRRFAPEMVGTHMEAGDFDIVVGFGTAFYGDYANPTNFRYFAAIDEGYNHMSFRLGHFDWDTWENVYSPGRNAGNPVLRRAMAFAIDENALGQYIFNGLQFQAASYMPPNHIDLMDFNVPIFNYDPDRARQMLDDAGFAVGDDGYRTHPDGSPLTIIWAYATGPLEDILVPFYIQAWSEIGIRVELWRGMTHDIFYLWDVLDFDEDDDEIDIYMAGWTGLWNPEPSGRWGHDVWNPSRYNSPEWEVIQARLISQEAWDRDYMRDAYSAMQWYMYEQAFAIPLRWTTSLVAVNNRVSSWDTRVGVVPPSEFGWHTIRLTEAETVRR